MVLLFFKYSGLSHVQSHAYMEISNVEYDSSFEVAWQPNVSSIMWCIYMQYHVLI